MQIYLGSLAALVKELILQPLRGVQPGIPADRAR